MIPLLNNGRLMAYDTMSPRDIDAVLAIARSLRDDSRSGHPRRILRGKNIGLLCEAPDSGNAALFERAASELGAHVSRIKPSLALLDSPTHVENTARMLGRLYDAVECHGVPVDVVQLLGRDAGVPVFDRLSDDGGPAHALAARLDGVDSVDEARRFVLQALLVSSLG